MQFFSRQHCSPNYSKRGLNFVVWVFKGGWLSLYKIYFMLVKQLMLAIDVGVGELGEKRPTKLIPTSRGASTSCGASTFCGASTSRVSLWRHASQAHCLKYIKPKNLRSLNKSSHLHHCIVLYCSIAHWNISICYWTLRTAPSCLLLNYFPIIIVEKGTEYIKKISIRIAISSQYFEHYFGVGQHFSPFQLSRPLGRHPC